MSSFQYGQDSHDSQVCKLDTSVSQHIHCNMAASATENMKPRLQLRVFINNHTCFYCFCSSFCAQIDTSYTVFVLHLLDVDCFRKAMAHAQKPDFVFRRKGRVHLNQQGASVQSTTSSRVVCISR